MKSEKLPASSSSEDPSVFTVWSAVAGGAIGLIIGLFTRQWLWPLVGCVTLGWVVGALIDRSRRK